MALFPLPLASEIRVESRLRPEQVSATLANEAALEADIQNRIAKKVALVESRILESISAADWAAMASDVATRRKSLATEATSLYVLASLYGSSGQLNPAYWERANQYRMEAKELMDALTGDLQSGDSLDTDGAGTGGATLSTSRYSISADGVLVEN
jgi:hypothetical protein